jgi:hypothetical protein
MENCNTNADGQRPPTMANQISLAILDMPGMADSCNLAGLHPELAGCKVRIRGTTPIYLIDPGGYRRLVPFPLTFMNLFEDRALLQVLVASGFSEIVEGPTLDNGAVLLRGTSSERIYLLDHGKKRLITSQRIMEKYEFSEEAVVVVPRSVMDAVPDGEIWE